MADSDIQIRRAAPTDLDSIIEVGAASLGWRPGEPNAELFRWKHLENPFGTSPIWLAESDGRIAGYRSFMRWELVDTDRRRWSAVRAVDTATHPDFQRQGIFSRLTMHAVAEMADQSVDIVFNTPNERSRPGYLKMGWVDVGRLPVAVRVSSLGSVPRLSRARTSAGRWSEPSRAGVPATAVLDDAELVELVGGQPGRTGLMTPLSAELLRWRYRLEPLGYRALLGDRVADGVVFFRIRRRGAARECTVGHVLAPAGNPDRERRLLRDLARAVDADYLIRLGAADPRHGFLPAPGLGPRLTAREVTTAPPADVRRWQLQLGDVELF